ncbi:TetR/AcrR family transcriptional regulator [Glycomyces mayteni]|uniref:TetR/AcrR family transcriptional regulator n=1 Tax=Glycomyces mayteni TaxID=543887 RepID=A0ABW2D616_9ACTN|nr:TetR/AcrR family transcriptional regulator [Glycomyces mayteni]
MTTRDRWIDEGLAVLAEQGADGLRIDRIAARLGLTKGSFHHHFAGADDYRAALLERHEHEQSDALADLASAAADGLPEAAFSLLADRVADVLDTDRERAVRAWSATDPAARAAQERLDTARLRLLERLWARHIGESDRSRSAALLPHLVVAGIGAVHPRPTPEQIRAVFALLAEIAPG